MPWDPCPDNVSDEEYMNEQLNDMVKKYKENEVNRDMLYEEEKREKMKESLNNSSQEAPDGSVNEEPQDSVNNLSTPMDGGQNSIFSPLSAQTQTDNNVYSAPSVATAVNNTNIKYAPRINMKF